jgi:omega-hydroxypalmitate O-feruloyl transferase
MENQRQETPPLLQDLKVTIQNSSLVFPIQETERKSIF